MLITLTYRSKLLMRCNHYLIIKIQRQVRPCMSNFKYAYIEQMSATTFSNIHIKMDVKFTKNIVFH